MSKTALNPRFAIFTLQDGREVTASIHDTQSGIQIYVEVDDPRNNTDTILLAKVFVPPTLS